MIRVRKYFDNIPQSLSNGKINDEVKKRLEADFNNKCCYCEDNNIKGTVEHFKPISKFPHLEFDWKNLLWACDNCNNIKGYKIEVENPIINPTEENPEPLLKFDLKGNIKDNNNNKAKKSIEVCGLNRENLNDKRKQIIDDFVRNLSFISEFGNKQSIKKYITDCFVVPTIENKRLSFIAFRKHIIEHELKTIIKDLL